MLFSSIIYSLEERTFIHSCNLHNNEIAKNLLQNTYSQIKHCFHCAFHTCCQVNNLEMAKIIYETGDIYIDYMSDLFFYVVCCHGYLEFAKWLYSVSSIDVAYNYNEFFEEAKKNNHHDICKWLIQCGINIGKNDIYYDYWLTWTGIKDNSARYIQNWWRHYSSKPNSKHYSICKQRFEQFQNNIL